MQTARISCLGVESASTSSEPRETVQSVTAEKRDLLARLLGRLAHEIRNPLSSINIHFQLLEEDLASIPEELKQKLGPRFDIIQGELHRLETIVERFLRLAGPSAVDPEVVELGKVIRSVCELLRPEAAARRVELKVWIEPGLPALWADPVRLSQALLNLLINSLQAVPVGGKIEVGAKQGSGQIQIEISDNGEGIPSEKLGSIFEPYFTTKEEGHGLGLWIAQQIAAAHGGGIEASNRACGGALFVFSLPFRPVPR